MNCHVIPFPAPDAGRCRSLATQTSVLADRIVEQHVGILDTAGQLLSLDDDAFARRLTLLGDAEGGALLADLSIALQLAATDLELAGRAVALTRARLAARAAQIGGAHV